MSDTTAELEGPPDATAAPDDPPYVPPVEGDDEPEGPPDIEPELTTRAEAEPSGREDDVADDEILEPKILPVERTLADAQGRSKEYTQAPMLYFQKMELYGILGRAVQIVMEGETGLGLDDLMNVSQPKNLIDQITQRMPGYDDAPDRSDSDLGIEDAGKMLSAFARVVSVNADLLKEAYCIILDIPKAHRNWAMEWSLPRIDDETGTDILHTFIDQNWGVMEDFFFREIPKIAKRAAQARRRSASARSKP